MRKIKIFTDGNDLALERRVNEWLTEHKTAIIHGVLQSESYVGDADDGEWSLTITIFYYEGSQ